MILKQVPVPTIDHKLKLINMHINRRCNLKCQMCGCWRDSDANKKEIPFEKIISIIDESLELGCETIKIDGGEPTLRKELLDIIKYISSKGIKPKLHTNASLFKKEYVRKLIDSGIQGIDLSFDSPIEQIHDKVRGCPGLFQNMLRGISYIREISDVTIHVNCTVMSNTYKELHLMPEFCSQNKINGVNLNLVRSRSSFTKYLFVDEQSLKLNKSQLQEYYYEILPKFYEVETIFPVFRDSQPSFISKNNLDYSQPLFVLNNEMAKLLRTKQYDQYLEDFSNELYGKIFVQDNFCSKPIDRMEIHPEGNVTTCCAVSDPEFSMGNIHQNSLKDIWNSQKYTNFRCSNSTPRGKECFMCSSFKGV